MVCDCWEQQDRHLSVQRQLRRGPCVCLVGPNSIPWHSLCSWSLSKLSVPVLCIPAGDVPAGAEVRTGCLSALTCCQPCEEWLRWHQGWAGSQPCSAHQGEAPQAHPCLLTWSTCVSLPGAASYPSMENPKHLEGNRIDLSSLLGLQPKTRQDQTTQESEVRSRGGVKLLITGSSCLRWEPLLCMGGAALLSLKNRPELWPNPAPFCLLQCVQ